MDSMRQRGRLRFLAFVVDELWRGTDVLSCSISICARSARKQFDGIAARLLRPRAPSRRRDKHDRMCRQHQLEGCDGWFWVSVPIRCVRCRSTHARFLLEDSAAEAAPPPHCSGLFLSLVSSSACFPSFHPHAPSFGGRQRSADTIDSNSSTRFLACLSAGGSR